MDTSPALCRRTAFCSDAQQLMLDCRHPAGWHPLLVLTVEDTLEQARE
jgi:hypothetical protein